MSKNTGKYILYLKSLETGEVGSLRNIFGGFIYINLSFANSLRDINTIMLARLTYLATYISYKDNVVRINNKRVATKSDIMTLLDLPKTSFYRFYSQAIDSGYIVENDKKEVVLNEKLFIKGNAEEFSNDKCRVMSKPYRDAYKGVGNQGHIYLGYCIKLMLYANDSWNVLCSNQKENKIEKVKGLTIKELAISIGKPRETVGQLLDEINRVRYIYDIGHIAELIKVFNYDGKSKGVIINPQIFYKGSGFYKFVAFDIFKKY